ncbi:hypothetical protein ACTXT7_017644 [Hymenolepis weldensis]
MSTETAQESRLMRAKGLLKKLKHPEEEECLWFFSDQNNFHQDEKTTVMPFGVVKGSEGEDLRVNANADVYVETLLTIVIKPPWIDNVANGTPLSPYIFQKDSAPSHKALKTHDYMDGLYGWRRIFIIMSHHTKLMAAS